MSQKTYCRELNSYGMNQKNFHNERHTWQIQLHTWNIVRGKCLKTRKLITEHAEDRTAIVSKTYPTEPNGSRFSFITRRSSSNGAREAQRRRSLSLDMDNFFILHDNRLSIGSREDCFPSSCSAPSTSLAAFPSACCRPIVCSIFSFLFHSGSVPIFIIGRVERRDYAHSSAHKFLPFRPHLCVSRSALVWEKDRHRRGLVGIC